MAITRASNLHIISTPALPGSASLDFTEYELVRLEDGRFVPTDTIKLDNAVFTAFGAATVNHALAPDAFWKSATGLAHDINDRIIYNTTTGVITYDVNGSIGGGAVAFAVVGSHLALTNADFMII